MTFQEYRTRLADIAQRQRQDRAELTNAQRQATADLASQHHAERQELEAAYATDKAPVGRPRDTERDVALKDARILVANCASAGADFTHLYTDHLSAAVRAALVEALAADGRFALYDDNTYSVERIERKRTVTPAAFRDEADTQARWDKHNAT